MIILVDKAWQPPVSVSEVQAMLQAALPQVPQVRRGSPTSTAASFISE